jgi:hypothetical protein
MLDTSYSARATHDSPLTDAQIARYAPSIFASEAHASRSTHYAYISSADVLRALRGEGFEVFHAEQSRTRDADREGHTKHVMRLRHRSLRALDEVPEVVISNSHDGSSSYEVLAGVLRLVCCNGLVVGDSVERLRIAHRGDVREKVVGAALETVKQFARVEERMGAMKAKTLSDAAQWRFAENAIRLRYPEREALPIDPSQVLRARRSDDAAASLWCVFNRAQEALTVGGLREKRQDGRRRRTRALIGIDQGVRFNRALWNLSEQTLEELAA